MRSSVPRNRGSGGDQGAVRVRDALAIESEHAEPRHPSADAPARAAASPTPPATARTTRPGAGSILVHGEAYRLTRAAMLKHKLSCLPEEPLRNACVPAMSVAENLGLPDMDTLPLGWWGVPGLSGAIRAGTPFIFVSLAECLTEKSGGINLGLEGTLVMGAMSAY